MHFVRNFEIHLAFFAQNVQPSQKKPPKMKNEFQFLSKNDKPIQNLKQKTNLKLDNLFVNGNNFVTYYQNYRYGDLEPFFRVPKQKK